MEKILELKNVSKLTRLYNLNFTLEKGYIMGLVGPNGAGKTSTIKLIMNLLNKHEGEVKIFGMDNVKDEVEIKQKIGFVYDENIYPTGLNLDQIAKGIAPFYNNWDQDLFLEYLQRFDLDRYSILKNLSKGMKTKFAIAMALSHKPELIIMDEPSSGLDPIFRRELLEILQEIIQEGNSSVLFSTHITSDLEKVADYITFMNKGKVIMSDSYFNITKNYRLVKATKEIIEAHKEDMLGFKIAQYGAEGLTENWESLKDKYGEEIIVEKATIEEMLYYLTRK